MSDELRQRVGTMRRAQRQLASAPASTRDHVLARLAEGLTARAADILAENRRDIEAAERAELAPALVKRLALDANKLETLSRGVLQLAREADPLGRIVRRTELDRGLVLEQVKSPIGVLLVIFESRPDAVIQIGSLALRSGNGVILKGGSEATHSNRVLIECLRQALTDCGLDPDVVLGVEGREAVNTLLELDDLIDLVIPRGSGSLVRAIQRATRIPVLGHAEGVCHLYLDAAADVEMAKRLALDGKCDYPAACNATETLLVHRDFLPHLRPIADALLGAGVELRADERARSAIPEAKAATTEDWRTEYGDLVLSIRVVEDIAEAIDHIQRYGSAHTDAIVTEDTGAAERFLLEVDSASVFHNASTRFADGYRYGLGAEVGISTSRIHARGPVGVEGLLTTRWLLRGSGQGAGDYGPGKASFTHLPLPLTDPSR